MSTPNTLRDPLPDLLRARRFDEAEALCRARLEADPADLAAAHFLLPHLARKGDAEQARALALRGVQASGGNRDLQLMLGQACEQLGDLEAARTAYTAAAAADADDWVAPLLLADNLERLGEATPALTARVQALSRAERDGALLPQTPMPQVMQARLQRAFVAVQRARGAELDAALAPFSAAARVRAATDALLGRRARATSHPLQQPTLLCLPDLPPQPWFERAQFPFLAAIERETEAIRAELLALLDDETGMEPYVDMPQRAPAARLWQELNHSPRWRAFHFHRHGMPVAAHLARCPRTAAALAALPLMRIPGHAPEAMFSLLAPRTRIPPHTGVINGRLTVHLPLVVPPRCGALRAGEEARPWEEGQCLVFDDSFIHEAWNDSPHLRAVLIFDIWHPALSATEREALSGVITALSEFNQRHGADDPLQE
ncbi:aspartyl/asparaginyl beta-hydroxylase domain-containing protein [Lysobacter rhizosphaerae]